MEARWNRLAFALNPRVPGWPIEYGLGMMRFRMPRIFTPSGAIPPVIGHTGATGSWLFYCRELDLLTAGTVDQATAAAAPFRVIPKLLLSSELRRGGSGNAIDEPPRGGSARA